MRTPPKGYLSAGVGKQRDHVHTVAHGCYCGSLIVGSANDERELARLLNNWRKLHPDGRTRDGVYHERTTVAHAKSLQQRRGQKVDASRVVVTDRRNLH